MGEHFLYHRGGQRSSPAFLAGPVEAADRLTVGGLMFSDVESENREPSITGFLNTVAKLLGT